MLIARMLLGVLGWFVRNNGVFRESADSVWSILTALRAADIDARERLKQLTTMRVRAILGVWDHHAIKRGTPLTVAEQIEREALLADQRVPRHFVTHYRAAVTAIRRIYKYDLKYEQPWQDGITTWTSK